MIITGGMGFIGQHLAKRLPDAFIWDRKISGQNSINCYSSNGKPVIHLAASTYLTEGYDWQMIEDNFILPHTLRNWFKTPKIVYASSAAVYNLNNLYAYSKKYAEDLFSDCNATGLRYYNVYGENDNGVVGKLIHCAMTGDYFRLNGGTQVRDFVYIDDVVQATIDAIDSKEKIIEVGTGIGTSIYDLMVMINQITGNTIKIGEYNELSSFETKVSICPTPLKSYVPLKAGLIKTIESWKRS